MSIRTGFDLDSKMVYVEVIQDGKLVHQDLTTEQTLLLAEQLKSAATVLEKHDAKERAEYQQDRLNNV